MADYRETIRRLRNEVDNLNGELEMLRDQHVDQRAALRAEKQELLEAIDVLLNTVRWAQEGR